MLPKVKGFSKNILIIVGDKGSKKYHYSTSFDLDPDALIMKSATSIAKVAVAGYKTISTAIRDQVRAYKMRRMMKKIGNEVAHLRAMVHL